MKGWLQTANSIGLAVEGSLRRAFDYLESRGFRFCVDFGTENAVEKAREHWRSLRRSANER